MDIKKETLVTEGVNINLVLISVFVLILTLVIFFFIKRKKVGRNIIFIGLSDSGKTLLFAQLTHSKYVQTHTSTKENVEDYSINNKSLQLIDIPGHERLRDQCFDKYKTGSRGITFVIDSSTLQKRIRDVAEYLHNILTDTVVQSIRPKFLILCNKQDDITSKGCEVIKIALEKEMNTLRMTKSSALDSVNSKNEKKTFLGQQGKDFNFSQLHQFDIEFAESQACSKASENAVEINQLKKWLHKVA